MNVESGFYWAIEKATREMVVVKVVIIDSSTDDGKSNFVLCKPTSDNGFYEVDDFDFGKVPMRIEEPKFIDGRFQSELKDIDASNPTVLKSNEVNYTPIPIGHGLKFYGLIDKD